MEPANILLIYPDQHRYDCTSTNGHPFVRTPNMERLASQGVNFGQAYCPIPLCVPTRNTLLHGQWPIQHQCICNEGSEAPRPPEPDVPTFIEPLHEAGYFLGYVGKWHVNQFRGPLDYGFDEYVPESAYAAWRTGQGLPPHPFEYAWFGKRDPHIGPEQSRLAWGADQTLRLLARMAQEDRPFFIRWDPSEPHLPNVVPEPYFSMYPPETIPPWPSYPDPLVGKPYIQAQQRWSWHVEDKTWDDWAHMVSAYLGTVSLLDAQLGRVLDGLEALGLAENTLVVYTTDHGDMCGGHGMVDKHNVMYDDVVRVPMIVRWPGHTRPGSACEAFVSNSLDLAPTFCEVAGASVPETFTGQSLVPLLEGGQTNGREDILCTYHGNQFGLFSQRMVRDRRWKYVWNPTALDELYDIESDPGELHNLAGDPGYRDELMRLRHRLVAWMESTGDILLNRWTRVQLVEGHKI
jgi:arylsulfatase A-like enzyme